MQGFFPLFVYLSQHGNNFFIHLLLDIGVKSKIVGKEWQGGGCCLVSSKEKQQAVGDNFFWSQTC